MGGETTTYNWDDVGRLITTTVGTAVSRIYTYSQSGDLTAVLVDNLLTTFVYDGDGRRLQMSVAGEVVTYTLDYAGNGRVLLEEGGAFADTKHYLYGLECIAELVDADEPESEWRYYHQDGNHLVRQTTNMAATVTLAWTYSPEGAILIGEKGPVTHMGCDGNTTYDFSTGLIFKNGKYFDPNTGIWITLSGMVIYHTWTPQKDKKVRGKERKRRWVYLCLLLMFLLFTGCSGGATTPISTATPCPTSTPIPPFTRTGNLPSAAIGIKFNTSGGDNSHRGTVIATNAILTSDHWTGKYNFNDIVDWELTDVVDTNQPHPSGIRGTNNDIKQQLYPGQFTLLVFRPTLGTLSSTANMGRVTALKPGDELEQAVVEGAGGNPGLFLTQYIRKESTGRGLQVSPDSAISGDSGMGLFENGVLYGANVGGNGWYGAIDDPGVIRQKINTLTSSF